MDILGRSTLLYVTQTRQENLEKLIGHRFTEASSWRKFFKKVIILCYSSSNEYLYKKLYNNCYLIAIPFDLSQSSVNSIINLGKNYFNLLLFLFKLIKITKIDIIRLENIVISGPPVYILNKLKKIPHVIWLGGYERKAVFAKYQKNPITRIVVRLIKLFEIIILKNANFVYPVSDELVELTEKRNIKNKIYSPNYIDLSIFHNDHKKHDYESKEKIQILFVGRFEEEKGLRVLLNAVKNLSNESYKFDLLMVGDGSLKDWIIEFIKRNKIKNVKLLGTFDYSEMPKIYNQADIFILPSHTEGSPGTVIEAMGCGTATICTAVGECQKIIKNGYNGLLIPPDNPEQISAAILNLLNNRNLIKKFSKNGRISVIKRTENYIKIHKFVYEQILKESKT